MNPKMSSEEMRIVIAEALGWKDINGWMVHPDDVQNFHSGKGIRYAAHLTSRDAAISAVVELIGKDCDKRLRFGEALYHVVPEANLRVNDDYSVDWDELYPMLIATPEQICTALIKALNLDQKGAQG
jgi:hypothetical protein